MCSCDEHTIILTGLATTFLKRRYGVGGGGVGGSGSDSGEVVNSGSDGGEVVGGGGDGGGMVGGMH